MTLSTWKTEFYPTEASECSKEDAIEHSLRKWSGLRKEALERHEAYSSHSGNVIDGSGGVIFVGANNCALCHHFYDEDTYPACSACPLAKSRNGAPCDSKNLGESSAPWFHWTRNSDPEPMIAALIVAQKEQS